MKSSTDMLDKEQKAVLESIVEAVSRAMNLPACIWVLDEEAQALRIGAAVGLRSGYVRTAVLKLEETSVTGIAFKTGEPLTVLDVTVDPRWKYKDEAKQMGWKSALSIPVRVRDSVIGVISIYAFVERHFTDLERQLLADYATQIELSLESARQREMLSQLLDVGHAIERLITSKPKRVLQHIVQSACEVTRADCTVVYPYDPSREQFYDVERVAAYGLRSKLKLESLTSRPRAQDGMAAHIREEGEITINDMEQELSDRLGDSFIQREGIQAFMGVSLKVGESVVGVLYVDFRTPHKFTKEEKDTIRLFAHQAAIAIHNTRLYERSLLRAERLALVSQVAGAVNSALGLERILKTGANGLAKVVGVSQCAVALFDEDGEYATVQAEYCKRGCVPAKGTKISLKNSPSIDRILETKEPLVVEDAQHDPILANIRHLIEERRTQSIMIVPIMIDDEVIGTIGLDAVEERRTFSSEEIELAKTIADQMGTAIKKARLLEETQYQLEHLSALFKTSEAVGQSVALDEILALVLAQAFALVGKKVGYIILVERKTKTMRIVASRGVPKKSIKAFHNRPTYADEGTFGIVIREGEILEIHNAREDPRVKDVGLPIPQDLVNIPLRIGQQVIGILVLDTAIPNEQIRQFLSTLSDMAAVAVQRAQLFERTERRAKDFAVLNEVGNTLTSGIRLHEDEILELIYKQASELMDTSNMYIALYNEENDEVRFGLAVQDGKRQEVGQGTWASRKGGKGSTEHMIKTGKPILLPKVEEGRTITVEEWYKTAAKDYAGGVAKSWLGVPLIAGKKVLGVIAIYNWKREWVYSEDDLEVLLSIGSQAAIALDNANLYYEVNRELEEANRNLERRIEQLKTVREIANAIQTHEKVPSFLQSIIELSLPRLGAQAGTIQLLDKATNELIVQAAVGPVMDRKYMRISLSQGITGQVAREKRIIYVPDTSQSEVYLPYLGETRSEIAAPLLADNEVIGVFNVEDRRLDAFDEDSRELFKLIADQVAVHVQQKMRLEEEGRKRKEAELEAEMGLLTREIAHHVRGKMGLIRLAAQELLDEPELALSELQEAELKKVVSNADSTTALADKLFDPYEPGKRESVKPNWLLQEAITLVGKQEGIETEENLSPELPDVLIDPHRASSYFQEILINALKAIRRHQQQGRIKQGQIQIVSRLAREGSVVEALFTNNGPPIPKEQWETIFEKFTITDESVRDPGSHGLGLWGARTFFKRQGGDVRVLKSDDTETTFLVCLPISTRKEVKR